MPGSCVANAALRRGPRAFGLSAHVHAVLQGLPLRPQPFVLKRFASRVISVFKLSSSRTITNVTLFAVSYYILGIPRTIIVHAFLPSCVNTNIYPINAPLPMHLPVSYIFSLRHRSSLPWCISSWFCTYPSIPVSPSRLSYMSMCSQCTICIHYVCCIYSHGSYVPEVRKSCLATLASGRPHSHSESSTS